MLFAAVLVVSRRNRRSETRVYPIAQVPVWRLLVQEAFEAMRSLWRNLRTA